MNIEKLLKEAYLNGFEDAKITDKVKGLKFDYNGMAEHYAQTKVKNLDIQLVSDHVPVDISDFLHRLRLAQHPEIRKQSIELFNRYCR